MGDVPGQGDAVLPGRSSCVAPEVSYFEVAGDVHVPGSGATPYADAASKQGWGARSAEQYTQGAWPREAVDGSANWKKLWALVCAHSGRSNVLGGG